jgi:hypothetical protein
LPRYQRNGERRSRSRSPRLAYRRERRDDQRNGSYRERRRSRRDVEHSRGSRSQTPEQNQSPSGLNRGSTSPVLIESGREEPNHDISQTSLSAQSPKRRSRWDRQPSETTSTGLEHSTETTSAEKGNADHEASSSDEDRSERSHSRRRTRWDQERR